MGVERIRRNLSLGNDEKDVIAFCRQKILDIRSVITRHGKNWYVKIDDCIITVNAYSYTIITAHKAQKQEVLYYVVVEFYSKIKISTNSYDKSSDNAIFLTYTYHQEIKKWMHRELEN